MKIFFNDSNSNISYSGFKKHFFESLKNGRIVGIQVDRNHLHVITNFVEFVSSDRSLYHEALTLDQNDFNDYLKSDKRPFAFNMSQEERENFIYELLATCDFKVTINENTN